MKTKRLMFQDLKEMILGRDLLYYIYNKGELVSKTSFVLR
jgi:hypothetical protein